jgi:hypothetical protein
MIDRAGGHGGHRAGFRINRRGAGFKQGLRHVGTMEILLFCAIGGARISDQAQMETCRLLDKDWRLLVSTSGSLSAFLGSLSV